MSKPASFEVQMVEAYIDTLAAELKHHARKLAVGPCHGNMAKKCDAADNLAEALPFVAKAMDRFLGLVLGNADAEIGALGNGVETFSIIGDAIHDSDAYSEFATFTERMVDGGEYERAA